MSISLVISGTARDLGYLEPGTAKIQRTIKGRSTASFTLLDRAQLYAPACGEPIVLGDGGVTLFEGTIDTIVAKADFNAASALIRFDCRCQDYASIFDHRAVSRRYPAGSITKNIILDIVANFLDGEGFTSTNVDGFSQVPDALEFDYRTVTECFNTITDLSGEQWWVVGKDIYFKSRAFSPNAPFDISDSSGNWADMEATYSRSTSYRNREFLRTKVQMQTGAINETYTANGTQTIFPTNFNFTSAPSMTINGVAQTMYQGFVDAPGQNGWYWLLGGSGVFQGTNTPPAAGATVVITYAGYDSNVVMVQNDAEIAARAAIEGGSGKWDMVDEANDVDTLAVAQSIAAGLLAKNDSLPISLKYRTDVSGLKPGMQQNVVRSALGINATFYITDIASEALPLQHAQSKFRHYPVLSSGMDRSHWTKWWGDLYSRIKQGRVGGGFGGDAIVGGATGELCVARFNLFDDLAAGANSGMPFSEVTGPIGSWDATAGPDTDDVPSGCDAVLELRSPAGDTLATVTLADGVSGAQHGTVNPMPTATIHERVGYMHVVTPGSTHAGRKITIKFFTKLNGLRITTAKVLPQATAGVAYSQRLVATGGTSPYTWTDSSPATFPGWLTLSGDTLTATSPVAGDYELHLSVADAHGTAVTQAFALHVA